MLVSFFCHSPQINDILRVTTIYLLSLKLCIICITTKLHSTTFSTKVVLKLMTSLIFYGKILHSIVIIKGSLQKVSVSEPPRAIHIYK